MRLTIVSYQNRLHLVKAIKELNKSGLAEAMQKVNNLPFDLQLDNNDITYPQAKKMLEDAGATVELKEV